MSELGRGISGEKYLCPNCGQRVYVRTVRRTYVREIKKEIIEYTCREAVCIECGSTVPVKTYDLDREITLAQMYCKRHNLITVDEIERILNVYEADKRQLPFLINVGEHTIERYLKGQVPNEKVSEMLKTFLKDYRTFQNKFLENKDDARVTDNTRRKVSLALERIEKLNSCATKIEAVALYIINSGYEITNLALQKLLYYADAVSLVKNDKPLFKANCEAWVHGPVYPVIYEKYKCFGREAIYDCDLNKDYIGEISADEKNVIDYILQNLAIYNGKILERSTHREEPWLRMREGYFAGESCNEIIDKDMIKKYFKGIADKYNILNPEAVERYVREVV